MGCWTTAMTAMNDLIEGKPQSVQSGALLLALSAWHLYPDISVQSTSLQFIKQADPLVDQGGVITVGLQNRKSHSTDGVYWSLPLAHLRVYGKPVVTTRNNGISHTQITFSQFLIVTLGSLFNLWHISEADVDVAGEIICRLARINETFTKSQRGQGWQRRSTPGLGILGRAAQLYLSSKGPLREEYARLLAYGRRRCGNFLANNDDRPPHFFGLASFPIAFSLFTPDPPWTIRDRQVDFLRLCTYKREVDLTGVIICYKDRLGHLSCTSVSENRTGAKRKYSSAQVPLRKMILHWGASTTGDEGKFEVDEYTSHRFLAPGPEELPLLHDLMYGDAFVAAVYRPTKGAYRPHRAKSEDCSIRPRELLGLLRDGSLDNELILAQINKDLSTTSAFDQFADSMEALSFAGRVYEHLDDAKIDMQICLKPLNNCQYSRALNRQNLLRGYKEAIISIKLAFSCIILFQTGRIDVDPEVLEGAMAISHSDSIFVAQSLLVDPSHSDITSPVRRIIGNVGKPGLAILLPPHAPEVRERSLGDWRVVNHAPFDGKYEDNFGSTSLHLAFTGSAFPIDVGERGSLTPEAHFIETVISVYEAGEWVADLDVLKAISDYKHGWREPAEMDVESLLPPLVSIDNWQEILDNPESSAVVRACGNEQARLAIVTVASQLGYPFRIIEPGNYPKSESRLVQSPPVSESHEKDGNHSQAALSDGPETPVAMAGSEPRDTQVYSGSGLELPYEPTFCELSPLDVQCFRDDETISRHSSEADVEQSKGHQHMLYIC